MGKSFKSKYAAVPNTLSSPLAVPLARPSSWRCDGDADGPYEIMRFNFLVEERPLRKTGYGDAKDSLVSPANAELQTRTRVTFEYDQVDSTSLVQDHLQSSGFTDGLSADMRLNSEAFGTAGFSSALEEHFTETFKTTQTIESARTMRFTREEEITITAQGGAERSVHAAPYRLYEMSVRLHHVDFLKIRYRSTHAGLRVRREKEPALATADALHRNFHGYGLLLGSYRFWRREGNASQNLISVSDYESQRINPQHVSFHPDNSGDRRFYNLSQFKRTPSLYKISNAAFPLKESQRRDSWTEEDLLLLKDLEDGDSSWAWENRRRTRRRAWVLAGPGADEA